MKTRTARAAAAASGLAIAAAFAVSCSQATEATKDAMSSASSAVSSGASAAGSAASSAADAAGSAASSAANAAGSAASSVGSAASSAASGASSAASSGASAASSAVSSAIDAATTMNVPGVGDVSLDTPTADAYTRLGGASALGIPTGVSEKVGDGTVTPFEKGTIFSSPAGSYVVQGEILQRYMNDQGGPAGALGWPTADETETGGGYKKAGGGWIGEFQNGTITWLNDGKGNFNETISLK